MNIAERKKPLTILTLPILFDFFASVMREEAHIFSRCLLSFLSGSLVSSISVTPSLCISFSVSLFFIFVNVTIFLTTPRHPGLMTVFDPHTDSQTVTQSVCLTLQSLKKSVQFESKNVCKLKRDAWKCLCMSNFLRFLAVRFAVRKSLSNREGCISRRLSEFHAACV